jgi:hypothetical protein
MGPPRGDIDAGMLAWFTAEAHEANSGDAPQTAIAPIPSRIGKRSETTKLLAQVPQG